MADRHGASLCGSEKMTNSDCTLYKYGQKTGGYTRYFIQNVYWQEGHSKSIVNKLLESSDNTTVFFFSAQIVPETPAKDILVKGNCEFEFDNTSESTISDSMKQFRRMYKFVTVSEISDFMFGGLPHIEITAK